VFETLEAQLDRLAESVERLSRVTCRLPKKRRTAGSAD